MDQKISKRVEGIGSLKCKHACIVAILALRRRCRSSHQILMPNKDLIAAT